jgi:hypothetical protein
LDGLLGGIALLECFGVNIRIGVLVREFRLFGIEAFLHFLPLRLIALCLLFRLSQRFLFEEFTPSTSAGGCGLLSGLGDLRSFRRLFGLRRFRRLCGVILDAGEDDASAAALAVPVGDYRVVNDALLRVVPE